MDIHPPLPIKVQFNSLLNLLFLMSYMYLLSSTTWFLAISLFTTVNWLSHSFPPTATCRTLCARQWRGLIEWKEDYSNLSFLVSVQILVVHVILLSLLLIGITDLDIIPLTTSNILVISNVSSLPNIMCVILVTLQSKLELPFLWVTLILLCLVL